MKLPTFFVEDNATLRAGLIGALEEMAGVLCVGFAEGEAEAVSCLEDMGHWKLAVIDLFLREGSGLGVLQAVSTRGDDQFVVILSNFTTPALRDRCLELGADAVFDKSSELDGLLAFCRQHAMGRRPGAPDPSALNAGCSQPQITERIEMDADWKSALKNRIESRASAAPAACNSGK